MDGQESAALSSAVAPKRRQPHSPMMWKKIRPSLKYYYLELDMTLEDAMSRISAEHDFHATKQMYKKRLKAWGFSKQIKSSEKEQALARILHSNEAPNPDDCSGIRPDKLIRYAKSRVKSGALDSHFLSKIAKQTKLPTVLARIDSPATSTISLPRSPALPDQFAEFDVFLRAMHVMIERECREYLQGSQHAPDAIFSALTTGMSLWSANAFTAARTAFGQAAHMTLEDLRGSEVSVSRIAYCVSSILWGPHHHPVFTKFVDFMVAAALEVVGPNCPITIVLKHVRREEQSVDAQVRIWACALDGYRVNAENFDHWWNMARRRWQWCLRSERFELAEQYYRAAVDEARDIGLLTDDMEEEVQGDLEQALIKGNF